MLSFLNGLVILAGIGAAVLVRGVRGPLRALVTLALVCAGAHLCWQACRASFTFPADRRNPYVYAHPVMDVKRLTERVEHLAGLHPDGEDMLVRVIAPDPWPLPWYLRRMGSVGYWMETPEEWSAPVVIASTPVDRRLSHRLHKTHHVQYYGLRPPVVLALFVESGLWEKFLGEQKGAGPESRSP
jgi:predicted membrane-bound mannosyltransferase